MKHANCSIAHSLIVFVPYLFNSHDHIVSKNRGVTTGKYEPARSYFTFSFYRNLKAIWVKSGQNVYPGVVQ
jgi:hypothetical protein